VVGLLGGLASGKSSVAAMLRQRGAEVVDADRIAHEVLRREPVRRSIRRAFGPEVFDPDGSVNRAELAEAAFENRDGVDTLNAVVHPPVLDQIRRQVARHREEPGAALIVIDAPLLMETGLDEELCDTLLFVDAPPEVRRKRAVGRGAMSGEQFARREAAQLPAELKRRKADHVVRNNGTLAELAEQVDELWASLCPAGSGGRTQTETTRNP
jgi:dephospho-CoA kinase